MTLKLLNPSNSKKSDAINELYVFNNLLSDNDFPTLILDKKNGTLIDFNDKAGKIFTNTQENPVKTIYDFANIDQETSIRSFLSDKEPYFLHSFPLEVIDQRNEKLNFSFFLINIFGINNSFIVGFILPGVRHNRSEDEAKSLLEYLLQKLPLPS